MKMAIVHDWFDTPGGAEQVIESLISIYPDSDLFALVDFFSYEQRQKYLHGKKVTTTFIQQLPFAKTKFRNYLPLFPLAIEQLNLNGYDVVISSSHAVAKGVLIGPEQLHICYQYSPMRYAWDMHETYFKEHNIKGVKKNILKYILHKIRIWDVISSNRVDYFIAISNLVGKRIEKYYRRESEIIYPPVNTDKFTLNKDKSNYYLTVSRLVPYKKIKLIVEAFNKNQKKLKIVGTGVQYNELKRISKSNIDILGYCKDEEVISLVGKAKAFVYAANEDFGIAPVEAMACGTPVICYGKGGTGETVIDGKTGIHFHKQTIQDINEAVNRFENITFNPVEIREHAMLFSSEKFENNIYNFISKKIEQFHNKDKYSLHKTL